MRPLPPRLAFIAHKCEPKLPHGTCGRFRDTKDPRLGRGADVAGPLSAATSRLARGLAGFLATWRAVGPRPGARVPALRLQKISAQATCLTKAGSQLPACRDGKLFELLEPYSTSKPDQLR